MAGPYSIAGGLGAAGQGFLEGAFATELEARKQKHELAKVAMQQTADLLKAGWLPVDESKGVPEGTAIKVGEQGIWMTPPKITAEKEFYRAQAAKSAAETKYYGYLTAKEKLAGEIKRIQEKRHFALDEHEQRLARLKQQTLTEEQRTARQEIARDMDIAKRDFDKAMFEAKTNESELEAQRAAKEFDRTMEELGKRLEILDKRIEQENVQLKQDLAKLEKTKAEIVKIKASTGAQGMTKNTERLLNKHVSDIQGMLNNPKYKSNRGVFSYSVAFHRDSTGNLIYAWEPGYFGGEVAELVLPLLPDGRRLSLPMIHAYMTKNNLTFLEALRVIFRELQAEASETYNPEIPDLSKYEILDWSMRR